MKNTIISKENQNVKVLAYLVICSVDGSECVSCGTVVVGSTPFPSCIDIMAPELEQIHIAEGKTPLEMTWAGFDNLSEAEDFLARYVKIFNDKNPTSLFVKA